GRHRRPVPSPTHRLINSKNHRFPKTKGRSPFNQKKRTIFPHEKDPPVFLTACVVLTFGCRWVGIRGNRQIKTEERTIAAFTEIDAGGAFIIEWESGSPALRITTDENLLSYVESDVSGDTLRLRTHEQIWPTHGIKVVI